MADIFDQIVTGIKKVPTSTVGGVADLFNTIVGGYANIVDVAMGKPVSRDMGEGLVKDPIGGSVMLNRMFNLPEKSSGVVEDAANFAGGLVNPATAVGATAGMGKAIVVAALSLNDKKLVDEFTALAKTGVDALANFAKTGIYKGPVDGALRSVIDDSTAKLKPASFYRTSDSVGWDSVPKNNTEFSEPIQKLSDVLDHPELFKAYPELKDFTVGNKGLPNTGAFYHELDHFDIGPSRTPEGLMSTLLHETQHAVQEIEGFARGGSPRNFLPGGNDFYDALNKVKGAALAFKTNAAKTTGFPIATVERFAAETDVRLIPQELKANEDFNMYVRTRQAQIRANTVQMEAFESYRHVAGEAEARATQRMYEERTGPTFPLLSYDVDPSALIQNPTAKVIPKP